uniref:thiol oxidase n=1 Tax=viral metagenome TaxID=1070528 RepID=A0A6C0B043_9ZZZZ
MTYTHKKRNSCNVTRKHREKKHIYTKDEYKSGDGMLTSVWGPSLWHFLHTMSFNYPIEPTKEQQTHYRNFILSLRYILPCKYCRINLKTNFKSLPLTMDEMKSRETFSRYIYNLHELVNKMLHKTSNLSYCDVRERYEHFRARCTDERPALFKFTTLNSTKKNGKKGKKEKGCTEPLYGKKSKCIIKIVPQDEKGATFQMDKKCIKTRE